MSSPLRGRARRCVVTLAVLAGLAVPAALPAAAAAEPAPAPAAATVAAMTSATITGHGNGHGRGLGQYGAYGYAVNYHWTYKKILARFYGGTHIARAAAAHSSTHLNVRITALDGVDVRISAKSVPFTVGNKLTFAAGHYAVIRLQGGKLNVYETSSCVTSGAMTLRGTVTSGTVRPSIGAPGNDVRKMLSVCEGATRKDFRGSLTFETIDGTGAGRRLINTVGLDDYLRGVVPRESPASWADAGGGWGREALRSQAVAARGYAITDPHGKNYIDSRGRQYANTCDTTVCQVYGGAGTNDTLTEDYRSNAAVSDTSGLVMVNAANQPVNTEFSASTGGFSAGGTFPAVSDQGDAAASNNPYHDWTTKVSTAPLQAAYGAKIGTLTSMKVTLRDGHGAGGGRAIWVRLYGTKGYTDPISGESFRGQLGLYSTWFNLPAA